MAALFKKIGLFSNYLYRHLLEWLSERNSLFRPRLLLLEKDARVDAPLPLAGCELVLCADAQAEQELGLVVRKMGRMDKPEWLVEARTGCYICDGALQPMVEVADALNNEPERRLVLSWCPACDHVQYSLRPSVDWFKDWYMHSFDQKESLEENLSTRPFTWRYYHRLAPFLTKKSSKILDLGAGYAEKTRAFEARGHQLFCVEPSEARADYLRSIGCTVVNGVLGESAVTEFLNQHGPFDLVFTYHVVEHVAGDLSIYDPLVEQIAEGGLFYIAVPDLYKEGAMNQIYMLEHQHSFSRTSGCRFLNRLGFEVVRAESDPFQYISNYCQYFLGRKKSGVELGPANTDLHKYPRYLQEQFQLSKLAGTSGTVTYQTFAHHPQTYRYRCAGSESWTPASGQALLRIAHGQMPLFWAS